jgi:hypothetical protein
VRIAQDEKEAIDRSNMIDSRTRGATKKAGTYQEPGDEEVKFIYYENNVQRPNNK